MYAYSDSDDGDSVFETEYEVYYPSYYDEDTCEEDVYNDGGCGGGAYGGYDRDNKHLYEEGESSIGYDSAAITYTTEDYVPSRASDFAHIVSMCVDLQSHYDRDLHDHIIDNIRSLICDAEDYPLTCYASYDVFVGRILADPMRCTYTKAYRDARNKDIYLGKNYSVATQEEELVTIQAAC